MTELLIIGGLLFVAYTLAQGQRAQLAGKLQPNVLIQNTGGRGTVVTGEPNSASPLALTQQAAAMPPTAIIAPAIPPWKLMSTPPIFLGPPVTAVSAISGSTSFSTAADPATAGVPIRNYIPLGGTYAPLDPGIQRDLTI